ncbi:MAG: hypothetical protein DHS20C09_07600 [marine bacterium B5-7]|nr:MAG: hypothetical protein DHS20C09_07600 [marine bacterium B5-7]
MLCENKRVIVVATNAELLNEHYYRRLWIAARNLQLPRRRWLDEIAECFLRFNGSIVYASGQSFPIPLVDDVFGDDPDMRWLSYYLKADLAGMRPHTVSRKMDRIQLIDLYFRIKHPSIARHFGR